MMSACPAWREVSWMEVGRPVLDRPESGQRLPGYAGDNPPALGAGCVLDQPAQAQGAGGRVAARLLISQPEYRRPQRRARHSQKGQQRVVLVGYRLGEIRHPPILRVLRPGRQSPPAL
jgi:hypothetical protein